MKNNMKNQEKTMKTNPMAQNTKNTTSKTENCDHHSNPTDCR
ncbi:MAG: hypothetical protein ACOX6P_02430 [Candidatus Merdivicinus sp.]|jgi:hypothetical protein